MILQRRQAAVYTGERAVIVVVWRVVVQRLDSRSVSASARSSAACGESVRGEQLGAVRAGQKTETTLGVSD